MKQQRHQASVTAFFDMLRLRKLPTCIKVDGPLGLQRPYVESGNPSLDPWLLTSNGRESYCFASEVSTYLLEIPNKFAKAIGSARDSKAKKYGPFGQSG